MHEEKDFQYEDVFDGYSIPSISVAVRGYVNLKVQGIVIFMVMKASVCSSFQFSAKQSFSHSNRSLKLPL